MKKILSALAAALLGCTALCTPVLAAETEEPVYQMGDVNMDGTIDCYDAQLALEHYANWLANKGDILTEQQIKLANINRDEFVSALDAAIILHYYIDRRLLQSVEFKDAEAYYLWSINKNAGDQEETI